MAIKTKASLARAKSGVKPNVVPPKLGKRIPANDTRKTRVPVPESNGNGKVNDRLQPKNELPSVPKINGAEKATVKTNGTINAPKIVDLRPKGAGETAMGGKSILKSNAIVAPVAAISAQLVILQRKRSVILKSRNMQANRLQAIVAGTLGYSSGMPEKERRAKFVEASKVIKAIADGKPMDHPMKEVIQVTLTGINAFNNMKAGLEKEMVKFAKQLPVAKWVQKPEQRGFGLLFLAIVIGETGDLFNYSNPGKVWRRLGCAPWEFGGKVHMGASWRMGKDKLPAEEWSKFGYSPRRRSIAYLIGEGIVKQNTLENGGGICDAETEKKSAPAANHVGELVGASEETAADVDELGSDDVDESTAETEIHNGRIPGPYRRRYDETKAAFKASHTDVTDLHAHRHGMLLATKRLLRELWIEWWKQ